MRFYFLFLFFFSTLFSIDPSTPDEVANLSAQPSSIVGGYINVITGDFVYRRSDLTIQGAVSLTVDIKDKKLVSEWYDFWAPLEIRRAVEGNNIDKQKAMKELKMMKEFLLKNTER